MSHWLRKTWAHAAAGTKPSPMVSKFWIAHAVWRPTSWPRSLSLLANLLSNQVNANAQTDLAVCVRVRFKRTLWSLWILATSPQLIPLANAWKHLSITKVSRSVHAACQSNSSFHLIQYAKRPLNTNKPANASVIPATALTFRIVSQSKAKMSRSPKINARARMSCRTTRHSPTVHAVSLTTRSSNAMRFQSTFPKTWDATALTTWNATAQPRSLPQYQSPRRTCYWIKVNAAVCPEWTQSLR